jgi:hypothetical protein
MLSTLFGLNTFRELNLPINYHPFPKAGEREQWETVSPETAKEWIAAGEKLLTYTWPQLTAEMCISPRFTGEFTPHTFRFRERRNALGTLAFAECFEGSGRFIMQILSGIVSIIEETTWIQLLSFSKLDYDIALPSDQEVDLSTSETAALLAWIDYLLGEQLEQVSKRIRKRIRDTVNTRILQTYLDRDDYWWMGFEKGHRINNWNPWCNKNVIICFLLLCDDERDRARGLHKAVMSLDRYLATYSEDGCCDEGPMYWGAAGAGLFACLELLRDASGGAIDGTNIEKLRTIGEYIAKVFIHDKYYVNYADGDAHVTVGSSVYRFGKALNNPGMMALGARGTPIRPIHHDWFHTYDFLMEIFTEKERATCEFAPPYLRESWFPVKGVLTAREKPGSAEGLYLSAKAGDNVESHNHNDVGNFIVYADGNPVLIDLGTEEYRAQTFNEHRYELWYTQSQFHNCPGVRDVLQHVGAEFRSTNVQCQLTDTSSSLSMELAEAYPKEAGIQSLKRDIVLLRGNQAKITLQDHFHLLNPTNEIFEYLISLPKPVVPQPGVIKLEYTLGKVLTIHFNPELLEIAIEEHPISEYRLGWNWGDMVYRIILKVKTAQAICDIQLEITCDLSK